MPISRQFEWIKRDQEDFFFEWVKNKKPLYWPIIGEGGVGKSSLLRKFQESAESIKLATIHLDPSKLVSASAINGLSFLLTIETINTPEFSKTKKKLISSTKQLSSILIKSAINSENTLKTLNSQVEDENWGVVIGTIKDTLKIANSALDHKSEKNLTLLKEKPEELLLISLYKDFTKQGGLILVDTWEQSLGLDVVSQLTFKESGSMETLYNAEKRYPLKEYLAGLIYYYFDLNVLFIVAGRHAPVELAYLETKYLVDRSRVLPFNKKEIKEYLLKVIKNSSGAMSITRAQLERIFSVTRGSPLLISKLAQLAREEISSNKNWSWSTWDILNNNSDLLETMVERLVATTEISIDRFWRIAIPNFLFEDMFDILFFDNTTNHNIKSILLELENKDIIYHNKEKKQIYIHDVIRDSIISYARKKNLWLSEESTNIHRHLAEYYYHKSDSDDDKSVFVLEGSYHSLMADSRFEERYSVDREEFWNNVNNFCSLSVCEKKRITDNLASLSSYQINSLITVFKEEKDRFSELAIEHPVDILKTYKYNNFGDIHKALEFFLININSDILNTNSEFNLFLAENSDFSELERTAWYKKSISLNPNGYVARTKYAHYLSDVKDEVKKAQDIFNKLLESDNFHIDVVLEWMKFVEKNLSRKDQIILKLSQRPDSVEIAEAIVDKKLTNEVYTDYLKKTILPEKANAKLIVKYVRYLVKNFENIKEAKSILKKSIENDSANEILLSEHANFTWKVLREYPKANKIFSNIVTNNKEVIFNHAVLLLTELGDNVRSKELFERVLELDEYSYPSLVFLGRIAWSLYDFTTAEKYFRSAISLKPFDPELALRLGLILFSKRVVNIPKQLIITAVNGKLSGELDEVQLEILFYGLLIDTEVGLQQDQIADKIKELLTKTELKFVDYHKYLFPNDVPSDFNWNDSVNNLFKYLTEREEKINKEILSNLLGEIL